MFFHNDVLGSPVLATDSAGKVLGRENYSPFGERQVKDPAASGNTLWFTGKPQNESSGLSYFGARYYSPELGQFMSVDPVAPTEGNIHNFNRYAYANNNPYRYVDPDGRAAVPSQDPPGTYNLNSGVDSFSVFGYEVTAADIYFGVVAIVAGEAVAVESLGASLLGSAFSKVGGLFKASKVTKRTRLGDYRPDRALPRDKHGNPVPDTNLPHTQLGTKKGRKGNYTQAREFDANGKPVRDIDFTDHGRPENHPNPHQHRYVPNETGGTPRCLKDAEPL